VAILRTIRYNFECPLPLSAVPAAASLTDIQKPFHPVALTNDIAHASAPILVKENASKYPVQFAAPYSNPRPWAGPFARVFVTIKTKLTLLPKYVSAAKRHL
jgi:hypothetical protein